MNIQLEVCIDNLESISNAIDGGATRIELCSSLALGGLTPSYGVMKKAVEQSSVPIYAMIRPRQGDFLYSQDEIESMLIDIEMAKQAGVDGVVFGVLNANYTVNTKACQRLMTGAKGLGTTFHRAIDQCIDYQQAIEDIALLGCDRLLTSGLAANAYQGRNRIAKMVLQANNRFSIMAGAGLNADNVIAILGSGVTEVHLSGKTIRASNMDRTLVRSTTVSSIKMGADLIDDEVIPITSPQQIRAIKQKLEEMERINSHS